MLRVSSGLDSHWLCLTPISTASRGHVVCFAAPLRPVCCVTHAAGAFLNALLAKAKLACLQGGHLKQSLRVFCTGSHRLLYNKWSWECPVELPAAHQKFSQERISAFIKNRFVAVELFLGPLIRLPPHPFRLRWELPFLRIKATD